MSNQSLNLPYIILSGLVLLAIVAAFMVFQPGIAEYQATDKELDALAAQAMEKEERLIALDRKKSELQQQPQHEAQLAVVVPGDEAMPDVARILHRAGEAAGIAITAIRNDGQAEAKRTAELRARGQVVDVPTGVVPVQLNVKASGTYQQLRVLMEQIEKSPRIIDSKSLRVTRDTTVAELLNIELNLHTYYLEAAKL